MILKKKPIQKIYANNLTQKQLELSGSANINVSPSAVTELVAEPIPTNTNFEDNIADSDDEQIPDSKFENPNPIQTLSQPAVGNPPQPTTAKQATPAIHKQLQRIILFKESKITKFSK